MSTVYRLFRLLHTQMHIQKLYATKRLLGFSCIQGSENKILKTFVFSEVLPDLIASLKRNKIKFNAVIYEYI